MENLKEYFEYFVILILVIILIIQLRVLIYNKYFSKHFSNKKFVVKSNYLIDPSDEQKKFTIEVYNNNINDTRIIGLGYIYRNQSIDYFKTYLRINNLEEESRVVIPSRDSIKLEMEVEELEKIVLNNNRGKKKIKNIYVFVTDSLGLSTIAKGKTISKKLRINQISRLKNQKEEDKKIYKMQKLEKKNLKKVKCKARRERVQAKLINLKMRFKKRAKPEK